eukprot:scaffold290804_cov22-Tisochrysis_lutea.AAC.1
MYFGWELLSRCAIRQAYKEVRHGICCKLLSHKPVNLRPSLRQAPTGLMPTRKHNLHFYLAAAEC